MLAIQAWAGRIRSEPARESCDYRTRAAAFPSTVIGVNINCHFSLMIGSSRSFLRTFLAIVPWLAFLDLDAATAQTNQFFYDNLGRLAVVLDASSTNAAFYDYDAVGNIAAIRRQTVGPVNLFVFSPETAPASSTITLQGTGFSTILASNTVLFCGSLTGQVVIATANLLVVRVPTNALNCLISVATPSGIFTNSRTFVTSLGVQVSPASTNLLGTYTVQFTAIVYGTTNQNVTWNINGLIAAGSNTAWGIVSTNGLYTAPTGPPAAGVVTVRARSVVDPDPLKEGVATITILAPYGPIYSPTVSLQPGLPTVLGPVYSPTVSIGPPP